MSASLLRVENEIEPASTGDCLPGRLDGLLANCLDCELDASPHAAGREGDFGSSGSNHGARQSCSRLGRFFPSEHTDA